MQFVVYWVLNLANGKLAAALSGIFAANRQILATVIQQGKVTPHEPAVQSGQHVLADAAASVGENRPLPLDDGTPERQMSLRDLVQAKMADSNNTVESEAAKGYSIVFVGIENPIPKGGARFENQLQSLIGSFDGPVAIVINGPRLPAESSATLNILVPTGGTPEARLATEIGLALAKATNGTLTALHVFDPRDDTEHLRGRGRRQGLSILVEARRLGKRGDIPVATLAMTNPSPERAIRRATRTGNYNLVVIGTSLRQGHIKFLGPRSAALMQGLGTPILLIVR